MLIRTLKGLKRLLSFEFKLLSSKVNALFHNREYAPTNIKFGEIRSFEFVDAGSTGVKYLKCNEKHIMQSFYDIQSFSSNKRYIIVSSIPFISRLPFRKDTKASVLIFDTERMEYSKIYETMAWGTQLGTHCQWGSDDKTVYVNDIFNGKVKGVRINLENNNVTVLPLPIYDIDSSISVSYTPDLELINRVQPGYGVPEGYFSRKFKSKVNENGIYRQTLDGRKTELLLSIVDILNRLNIHDFRFNYYIFHVKVSKVSSNLFFVLHSKSKVLPILSDNRLIVYNPNEDKLTEVVSATEWRKGGHHPNWKLSEEKIVMNINLNDKHLSFVEISLNGEKRILAESVIGSGHPSVNYDNSHILTDCYNDEAMAKDGYVPIRYIDLIREKEETLFLTDTGSKLGPIRIDLHPVWKGHTNDISWNGLINGRRTVFIYEPDE